MLRDFFLRMLSPLPEPVEPHSGCIPASAHAQVIERARELEAEVMTQRLRLEDMERRLEACEARSSCYGQRYVALQKAAFPVSYLLTEGSCEEAMAINARLWEMVREEIDQA